MAAKETRANKSIIDHKINRDFPFSVKEAMHLKIRTVDNTSLSKAALDHNSYQSSISIIISPSSSGSSVCRNPNAS